DPPTMVHPTSGLLQPRADADATLVHPTPPLTSPEAPPSATPEPPSTAALSGGTPRPAHLHPAVEAALAAATRQPEDQAQRDERYEQLATLATATALGLNTLIATIAAYLSASAASE